MSEFKGDILSGPLKGVSLVDLEVKVRIDNLSWADKFAHMLKNYTAAAGKQTCAFQACVESLQSCQCLTGGLGGPVAVVMICIEKMRQVWMLV